MHFFASA